MWDELTATPIPVPLRCWQGGGAPGTRAEIPLQPVVRWQAVPLQPMEVNGGAEIPLQPVEDPTQEQFVEDCSPWKGLVLEKLMEG